MEEKKNGKFDKFFAGKGFYIVLALCVAVIGISAWSIIRSSSSPAVPDSGILLDDPKPALEDRADTVKPPDVNIDGIKDVIEEIDPQLEDVGVFEEDQVWEEEPMTWVRPVVGKTEREYSVAALAYDVTMADWRTHDGIDIAAECGAVVRAAADGTVESIEQDELYGTTVTISHGGGLKTVYSSLAEVPTVSVGDPVRAGDIIGAVGDTALCEIGEPSHLHFSISKDGKSVDPSAYLPD